MIETNVYTDIGKITSIIYKYIDENGEEQEDVYEGNLDQSLYNEQNLINILKIKGFELKGNYEFKRKKNKFGKTINQKLTGLTIEFDGDSNNKVINTYTIDDIRRVLERNFNRGGKKTKKRKRKKGGVKKKKVKNKSRKIIKKC